MWVSCSNIVQPHSYTHSAAALSPVIGERIRLGSGAFITPYTNPDPLPNYDLQATSLAFSRREHAQVDAWAVQHPGHGSAVTRSPSMAVTHSRSPTCLWSPPCKMPALVHSTILFGSLSIGPGLPLYLSEPLLNLRPKLIQLIFPS